MRLTQYLFRMTLSLLAVLGVAAWLAPRLESAFLANPVLNALLIVVWLIGVAYIFAQTLRLGPSVEWVNTVRRSRDSAGTADAPPLMRSLARLMADRATPLSLTPTVIRSVLDGVAVRLDEGREVARYFTGLMIFLGLLGTFWGLLKTVGSVGGVVNGLSLTADPAELFKTLKAGLEGPLTGMGTAFSSSLLGLAGSLVLGFLDLQLGQAQNRFFIDLEDWLFVSVRAEHGQSAEAAPSAYLQALIEQTAENIDRFQQTIQQAEDGRRQAVRAMQALAEEVGALAASHSGERARLVRAAEVDAALLQVLGRINKALDAGELGDTLAPNVRAIEAAVQRMADDQTSGRAEALREIRADIKLLARVLGANIDRTPG